MHNSSGCHSHYILCSECNCVATGSKSLRDTQYRTSCGDKQTCYHDASPKMGGTESFAFEPSELCIVSGTYQVVDTCYPNE